jgi:hypothetical protein
VCISTFSAISHSIQQSIQQLTKVKINSIMQQCNPKVLSNGIYHDLALGEVNEDLLQGRLADGVVDDAGRGTRA